MVVNAVILGHSFVKRLSNFTLVHRDVRVNRNFNLCPEEVCVSFVGYSGGRIHTIYDKGTPVIVQTRPEIVVLQSASNDLCDVTKTVEEVFRELCQLVITLLYTHGVKKVIVNQVLYRHPPSHRIRYRVDTVWFNRRVDELNRRLDNYLKDVEGATLFRLKGFWSEGSETSVFHTDGVHLNDVGNQKLYNNIRGSIITALKQIRIGGL